MPDNLMPDNTEQLNILQNEPSSEQELSRDDVQSQSEDSQAGGQHHISQMEDGLAHQDSTLQQGGSPTRFVNEKSESSTQGGNLDDVANQITEGSPGGPFSDLNDDTRSGTPGASMDTDPARKQDESIRLAQSLDEQDIITGSQADPRGGLHQSNVSDESPSQADQEAATDNADIPDTQHTGSTLHDSAEQNSDETDLPDATEGTRDNPRTDPAEDEPVAEAPTTEHIPEELQHTNGPNAGQAGALAVQYDISEEPAEETDTQNGDVADNDADLPPDETNDPGSLDQDDVQIDTGLGDYEAVHDDIPAGPQLDPQSDLQDEANQGLGNGEEDNA